MDRLSWYHHLRSGLTPMPASHAWLQALIYEGKELDDPYFMPFASNLLKHVDRAVIATYAKAIGAAWDRQMRKPSFIRFLMAER